MTEVFCIELIQLEESFVTAAMELYSRFCIFINKQTFCTYLPPKIMFFFIFHPLFSLTLSSVKTQTNSQTEFQNQNQFNLLTHILYQILLCANKKMNNTVFPFLCQFGMKALWARESFLHYFSYCMHLHVWSFTHVSAGTYKSQRYDFLLQKSLVVASNHT